MTIVAMGGLAGVGLAMPGSVLVGGAAWLGFLFFACAGWGYLVVRAARLGDVDFGLRAAWGVGGFLAVAGVLLALGVLDRTALLVGLGLGWGGAGWRELVTEAPLWRGVPAGWRVARAQPALAVLVGVLVAVAVFRMVGGVASLERNVWDDDVGYLPLVKRLLQVGDLTEPFSFRRLGAYGGQLVLQGLGAARGSMVNVHVADKGLCFGLTLLLLVGHARRVGAGALPLVLVVLLLLSLPDVGVNTASHWSGVVGFVALHRSLVGADGEGDERAARRWLVLAALVGAATCTLRQNYLAGVALVLVFALVGRLRAAARGGGWAAAWRAERAWWLIAGGGALAVLVPWWIAAFTSNRTFLFPLLPGTWNHGLSLRPTALSWMQELEYLVNAAIETEPLAIVTPLALLLMFSRDRRATWPLTALFLACAGSFLLLIHAFVGSDLPSLWRYLFGAGTALTGIFILESGLGQGREADGVRGAGDATSAPRTAPSPVQLPVLGRWALLAVVLLQLMLGRGRAVKTYAVMARAIGEAGALGGHGDPVAVAETRRYRAMQEAIPAGAPVAVLLDDAAYLDYARNPIANLDTPGYTSPGAPGRQLPSFAGPQALRSYFVAHGYRHVAFVRPDFSRYFYRRWYWLRELYLDVELFQVMAAYTLDTIDSLVALAEARRPLHDVDGLVVLELAAPGEVLPPSPVLPPEGEARRRDAWIRQLSDRLGLHAAWSMIPRQELVFDDGLSGVTFLTAGDGEEPPPPEPPPRLQELAGPASSASSPGSQEAASSGARVAEERDLVPPGTAVRWLHRRAHLRLRGERAMRLTMRGQVRREATGTRPRLTLSLDGALIASQVVAEDGSFTVDVPIAADRIAGWADLYVVFSSVGVPERDSRDLRFARLDGVEWEPQ